jgi:hypothetical protein
VHCSLEQEETTREEKSGFHDVKIVGIWNYILLWWVEISTHHHGWEPHPATLMDCRARGTWHFCASMTCRMIPTLSK